MESHSKALPISALMEPSIVGRSPSLANRIKQADVDGDGYLSIDDIITSLQRDARERRILKWWVPGAMPAMLPCHPRSSHPTKPTLADACRMAFLLVIGFLVVCGAMAGVTYGIVVRSKEVKSGDYGRSPLRLGPKWDCWCCSRAVAEPLQAYESIRTADCAVVQAACTGLTGAADASSDLPGLTAHYCRRSRVRPDRPDGAHRRRRAARRHQECDGLCSGELQLGRALSQAGETYGLSSSANECGGPPQHCLGGQVPRLGATRCRCGFCCRALPPAAA